MIGLSESPEVKDDFELCRSETKEHAKSFYFASHVLPEEKRLAAYAVYAFCRRADDIVDRTAAQTDTETAGRRLGLLRSRLDALYSPSGRTDGQLLALRDTLIKYQIPREYFHDLLRGVEMDLTKRRYASFSELREYCYCVASVVGLIMTRIFGASDERAHEHAVELGIAMQLTNILRDIGEDFRMGRIYLPADERDEFQYSEQDLSRGVVNEQFRALMVFQVARARDYYARAEAGIRLLTDDGSRYCVRLMSGIYAGILGAIEKNGYDVYSHRAHVPTRSKLALAARLAIPFGRPEGRRGMPANRFSNSHR
jgi:phytoene synthase